MSTTRFFKASRLTNIHVAVSKCGKNAVVQLPGLSIDDFNRVGGVGIWRVLQWFSLSRITAYHKEDEKTGSAFLEYNSMTSKVWTFLASTRTIVDKSFYQLLEGDVSPALSVTVHLGYIGTSSLNSVAILSDRNSGTVLARNVNQVVCIDRETRKPTPLPDWWKQKYESYVVENERLVLPTLEVPNENTFKYMLKVSWSDTDAYRHVNYQSYVRFCFDAAMEAVDKKFYSCFHNDILNYHVKSIESNYKGETHSGDMCTVVTWQNCQNPWVVHFSIEKDDKVVFQCSVEFFE